MIGKKIFSITILFLLTASIGVSAQADKSFEDANSYFQNKEFEKAVAAYREIENNGYESPELFYNLGNAFYKTGKLGYAILYFEKALKLSPGDEDIQYNLKIANLHTVDKIKDVPQIFIVEWFDQFLTFLTINSWSIVVIIFYLFLLGFILVFFFARSRLLRKLSFVASGISLGLFIISAVILFSAVNREATRSFGILLSEVQAVKVSPDSASNDAFVVHEGVKFLVEDSVSNWTKIKLADGKVGWLPNDVFERI